ncbi:MAG: hypothetical protein ABSG46_20390 [Candidatus Binataceae bacterium]|jgi:hypothetical protein
MPLFGRRDPKAINASVNDGEVIVLVTTYSEWHWLPREGKVQRWILDTELGTSIKMKGEDAILFSTHNNLEGATQIAANREYRLLLAALNLRAAQPHHVGGDAPKD